MLITKFRNKFQVNLCSEIGLDLKLVDMVNQAVLKSSDFISNRAVIQLQKTVQELVQAYRHPKTVMPSKLPT